MSSIDDTSVAHVVESIQQILLTRPGERSMAFDLYSDVDSEVFAPNDVSSHTLLKYQIRKAVELHEPRVVVHDVDVHEGEEENQVNARIYFSLVNFDGNHSVDVKVGESYV